MNTKDVLQTLADLAWPIIIGVVVWRLLPSIKQIIESRGFSIKAGSAEITVEAGNKEITVQQASDQLLGRVDDLREQLTGLKHEVAALKSGEAPGPPPSPEDLPELKRVLWVDDYPENNVYEVQSLTNKGVTVDQALSTGEAIRALDHSKYDAIITDMGRKEDGVEHPDAGLELVRKLRESDVPPPPVIVYASAPAVNRTRADREELGVKGTASATELLEMLGEVGLR